MDNVYEAHPLTNLIIIRRKPSQLPFHVDMGLLQIGSMGEMNGPANYVAYKFFNQKAFNNALGFLSSCHWTKAPSKGCSRHPHGRDPGDNRDPVCDECPS